MSHSSSFTTRSVVAGAALPVDQSRRTWVTTIKIRPRVARIAASRVIVIERPPVKAICSPDTFGAGDGAVTVTPATVAPMVDVGAAVEVGVVVEVGATAVADGETVGALPEGGAVVGAAANNGDPEVVGVGCT